MRMITRWLVVSVVLCPVAASFGEEPSSRFTLGRYIPADAWMYTHFTRNPEAEWIEAEWAEVFDALKASGIDRDVMSLVAGLVPAEEFAGVEERIDKLTVLLKAVKWGDLMGREFAFAERVAGLPIGYDYLALMRGSPGSAPDNMTAIVALLKELTSWSDAVTLEPSERGSITVWSVSFKKAKIDGIPLSIHLLRKGDIIGMVFGDSALRDVSALMEGKEGAASITDSARLEKSLSKVPTPEDGLMFFDMSQLFRGIDGLMSTVAEAKKSDTEGAPKEIGMVRNALELFDVADYIIITIETDGRRQFTHEVCQIQSKKNNSPVARVFLDRKPFEKFDKYVPADATAFGLVGMINLEHAYNLVLDFIKKEIPDGPEMIEDWNGKLAELEFNPQRDVFDWFSGEIISVTMPPVVVTPMSSADSVLMVRVKDSVAAAKKVDAALTWVSDFMQAQGQPLMVSPAQLKAEGFREIMHPAMAMFLRPVIGVHGNWIIVGTSGAAIDKCLAVAAGDAPSIATNPRFMEEGLTAKGAVHSMSFADTSNFGTELGGAVGMIGMFGGMATAGIPDEQGKQIVQKVLGMLMKLGPVLQKIDFFSSEASVVTVNGRTVRTESVVTYKPPTQEGAKTAEADTTHD